MNRERYPQIYIWQGGRKREREREKRFKNKRPKVKTVS